MKNIFSAIFFFNSVTLGIIFIFIYFILHGNVYGKSIHFHDKNLMGFWGFRNLYIDFSLFCEFHFKKN